MTPPRTEPTDAELLAARPRTRAECPARDDRGRRACPWLGCRHHLGLEVRRSRWRARVALHPALGEEGDDVTALADALRGSCCALDHAEAPRPESPDTYALDVDGLTLAEVGALLIDHHGRPGGVSRERVRQIEKAGLAKLRDALGDVGAEWLAGLADDPLPPGGAHRRPIPRSPDPDETPDVAPLPPAPTWQEIAQRRIQARIARNEAHNARIARNEARARDAAPPDPEEDAMPSRPDPDPDDRWSDLPDALRARPARSRASLARIWRDAMDAPPDARHEGWRLRVARLRAGMTLRDAWRATGASRAAADRAEASPASDWAPAEHDHAAALVAHLEIDDLDLPARPPSGNGWERDRQMELEILDALPAHQRDLAWRLRRARVAAGMTQRDLSDATGVDKASISSIERSASARWGPGRMHTALRLADALDVDLDDDTADEEEEETASVAPAPTPTDDLGVLPTTAYALVRLRADGDLARLALVTLRDRATGAAAAALAEVWTQGAAIILRDLLAELDDLVTRLGAEAGVALTLFEEVTP